MHHNHLSNPRTLGDTQRLFLATLRDGGEAMTIPAVGRALGMGDWRRQCLYRPMGALNKRGLVTPLADPRNDAWTIWEISDKGRQALADLGI